MTIEFIGTDIRSEKTAIKRVEPSTLAKRVDLSGVESLLDYGSGHGVDAQFYRDQGVNCSEYDPFYAPFWYDGGSFDVATCAFVLNVIPESSDRIKAIERIAKHAKTVWIAVRSGKDFNPSWSTYGDGFLTGSGTFQRGFTASELKDLVSPFVEIESIEVTRSALYLKGTSKLAT